MKKKLFLLCHRKYSIRKTLLVMKLTFCMLLLAAMSFATESYSQTAKLNLKMENVTIVNIFQEIERSSDVGFLFKNDQLDLEKKYSINVEDKSVEEVLEMLLGDAYSYRFIGNNVVIKIIGYGQQKNNISGTVTDQFGSSLPGVTVVVKGTTMGTVSDIDGKYILVNVPEDATLLFSFVGMKSQEIAVSGRANINVQMEEDAIGIEEVVAIGYGVQKKADVTGASTSLSEENMNKSVSTSPVEMMQGRVSGVNITQNSGEPGSGMSVRIRGSNSIRSGQEPLYVIDGVPLDNADLTPDGATQSGYNQSSNKNPLSFLSTDEIESIVILKDASSTAIYGARGANGVILVTTKKGIKGEGTLTYDGYVGVSAIREKMDVLSAADFRAYRTSSGNSLQDEGASIDWQDEIFRNSITNSHNLSYSGGNTKSTYRASLGYIDQQGIVEETGLERINGKMTITQKLFDDRLKLSGNLIVSHNEDTRVPIGETGGYEGDVILTSLKLNPTYPIFNDDGSYYQYSTTQRNPLAMIHLTSDVTATDRIVGNISGEIEIFKGLKYKLNVGLDRAIAERKVNQYKELSFLTTKGEADINTITANSRLVENYVTYDKQIGSDHHLTILAGHAYQFFKTTGSTINVNGFEVENIVYTDNLEYGNYSSASVTSSDEESELQSFFGRANYNFREKYLLTATLRADGSSKFGENNKYGYFPSAAFAWRASEEEFIKNIDVISNLKVRLGWGITGNQEIPNKISQISVGTTGSANGYFNDTQSAGITFLRTPNPDIQWETTGQLDFGLDFGILDHRINGAIDIFKKTTKNVLLEITSKAPAAAETQWMNVDDLKIINNGFELELNGSLVKQKDLTWDVGLNFSHINNNVEDLPVTLIETGVASGQGLSETRVQVITNDHPIGTFYGRIFKGLDSNGYSTYKTDESGEEVLECMGSALPDYTYSFNTSLKYKNFDFSMFWYGSKGNDVYNNTRNALFTKSSLTSGSNVTYEVANSNEAEDNSNTFSSRFVEDGSFLRLSNVTLGYTVNTKKVKWLSKARVYVTGNNLLLFTDYTGWDPEVSTDASYEDIPSIGIDYTSYPKARTFTFGVNLQF